MEGVQKRAAAEALRGAVDSDGFTRLERGMIDRELYPKLPTKKSRARRKMGQFLIGGLRVRSSIAFAPPYIVLHGSTGFCLLTGSARSCSKRPPPLPLGQTRDQNTEGIVALVQAWTMACL